MTSTVPDLPVPDQAVEMLSRTITAQLDLERNGHTVDTRDHDAIRAIAAPVLAAELRRLVAEHGGMTRGGDLVIDATVLTDRADELDPEETP